MDTDKIQEVPREVTFTIDGQPYTTSDRRQPAADLLRLAGLDPARYDLGELRGENQKTKRFTGNDVVTIRPGTRFVTIRHAADVA
ncbi:MAG TPA: hypothetical protein VNE62_07115 [Actinomycetota bacterium]|nr:hypothetical protein [Actinomycetota bacterium]